MKQGVKHSLLRRARESKGWSQEHLAELLGTNAIMVHRWESRQTLPGPYYRKKLGEVFEQSPEALGILRVHDASKDSTSINLPSLLPPFITPIPRLVGRDEEISAIKSHLLVFTPGVTIALWGLPGVGKTSVLREIAFDSDITAHYADGILGISLGPNPNILELLTRWGISLGLSTESFLHFTSVEDISHALYAAIEKQRMLLLIDDVWHIEDVLAFKVGGANCAYIVTTRFPAIARQFGQQNILHIAELNEQTSLDLLQQIAPEADEQEPELLAKLSQLTGGLPLTLTLMGHQLNQVALSKRSKRIHDVLIHLQEAENRIQLAQPTAPLERPAYLVLGESVSLQGAISASVAFLNETELDELYALAVLPAKPSSFSVEAVQSIGRDADLKALDHLVELGLIEAVTTNRYSLHQSIVDYARSATSMQDAEASLLGYFTQYTTDNNNNRDAIAIELQNILFALQVAYDRKWSQEYLKLANALYPFLNFSGMLHLASTLYSVAIAFPASSQTNVELQRACLHLSSIYNKQGKYSQSMETGLEGYRLAHSYDDTHLITALCHMIADSAMKSGMYEEAERYLKKGLESSQSQKSPEYLRILLVLGLLALRRNDLDTAQEYFNQGLVSAEEVNNESGKASFLANNALIAHIRCRYHDALMYNRESLEILRHLGRVEGICTVLNGLGNSYHAIGKFTDAESYYLEELELARRHQFYPILCSVLTNLGEQATILGQEEDSKQYLEEALILARQYHLTEKECEIYIRMAESCLAFHKIEAAVVYLNESASLKSLAHPFEQIRWQILFGQTQEYKNELDQALITYRQAEQDIPAGQSWDLKAWARFAIARVTGTQGDWEKAEQDARESLRMFQDIDHYMVTTVVQWLDNNYSRKALERAD